MKAVWTILQIAWAIYADRFLHLMKKIEKLLKGFGDVRGKKVRAGNTEIFVAALS